MDFLRTLLQQVQPGDTLLDIGANIGGYTTMMRSHCPLARIHAFEPLPAVFPQLVASVGDDPLTSCWQMGVGATVETIREVAVHEAWTITRLGETRRGRNATYGQDTFTMHVTSVDRFLLGWPNAGGQVSFLKIDTDGWDYRVLKGAVDTIQRCRPRILIEFGYCVVDLGESVVDFLQCIEDTLKYAIYDQDGQRVWAAERDRWYPFDTTRDYALVPAEQELNPLN